MTNKINPLAHISFVAEEPEYVRLAGEEFPFEPLGLDALGFFARLHPDMAGAFLGDKTADNLVISKDDEKAMQGTIIALALAGADDRIDVESTAKSIANLHRMEREIALTKIMKASFPDTVIESAEGKDTAKVKTIAAGPKPKAPKKAAAKPKG